MRILQPLKNISCYNSTHDVTRSFSYDWFHNSFLHGWPSTQPNRITHNRAAHHRAAHSPAPRLCTGSVVCNLHSDSNVDCPNVGPTSGRKYRRWANNGASYIGVWLVRLWQRLPIRVTHTTELAHNRAAGLCAVRWCAARLCVIRLGCVEGHPCSSRYIANTTFSALLALCAGNSALTGHKGQWRRALMFSLICTWINTRANNRDTGDMRRHHAHHDVIVMK